MTVAESRPPAVPRRVLLIDDRRDRDPAGQKNARACPDTEVFTAADGASGMALARSIRPDVIFCDIGLPDGMNGYDVAVAVRSDSTLGGVYVVALSGYGQEEDRRLLPGGRLRLPPHQAGEQ